MRITLKLSQEGKGSRFYRDLRIVCEYVCVGGGGVLYRAWGREKEREERGSTRCPNNDEKRNLTKE